MLTEGRYSCDGEISDIVRILKCVCLLVRSLGQRAGGSRPSIPETLNLNPHPNCSPTPYTTADRSSLAPLEFPGQYRHYTGLYEDNGKENGHHNLVFKV